MADNINKKSADSEAWYISQPNSSTELYQNLIKQCEIADTKTNRCDVKKF